MPAGGGNRVRTGDLLLAKQMLYQLSYTPDYLRGPAVRLARAIPSRSALSCRRPTHIERYTASIELRIRNGMACRIVIRRVASHPAT